MSDSDDGDGDDKAKAAPAARGAPVRGANDKPSKMESVDDLSHLQRKPKAKGARGGRRNNPAAAL